MKGRRGGGGRTEHLDKEMYCLQVRELIVVRVDANAEEEACIPSGTRGETRRDQLPSTPQGGQRALGKAHLYTIL